MDKASLSNYIRFRQLFRKGEQIVVGFMGGFTHGYITRIDRTGFGLFQLEKPKEYWYTWDKFELISHPGFRFRQSGMLGEEWIDKVNVFTIDLLGRYFPTPDDENSLGVTYTFHNSDDIYASMRKFDFEAKDFRWLRADNPWGELEIVMNNAKVNITAYNEFVQTLPDSDGNFDIAPCYKFKNDVLNFKSSSGRMCGHTVHDQEELDVMRITTLAEPVRISIGDPWINDDEIIEIGFRMWEGEQGFAMGNARSIVMETRCAA